MHTPPPDELLFGWDTTPGIVSVWADRAGRALVWRRVAGKIVCERERFSPWLLAVHLDDLAHPDDSLVAVDAARSGRAPFRYRELDGPAGALRFVISGQNLRALEQTIRAGASRRLGREIRSMYELESDYYRVGPVEQYLMASGRVYFRGLGYDDLHRMQIDLETTALDPAHGRIFMAAVRDNRGFAHVLEAPGTCDEAGLIAALCALVRERDPDVIENHNLFGFDLPFLVARAATLRVPLALGRREGPAHPIMLAEPPGDDDERWNDRRYTVAGRELIDTLDAVRRHDFVTRELPSRRLKDVARHFGVAAPERVYLAGADIAAIYLRDPETVRRYALDDVTEVDGLSRRLLRPSFALAGMAPRRYERVANAGSAMGILEPMLVRAYLRAGAAPPRPGAAAAAGPATPHAGGALHLYAAGIAERVVKADIASLYPSLMIRYAIGPACDPVGALLAIVQRLTELRLQYKDAARAAPPGSLDAGHYAAMQAAMKLIINSAYGYLGAGQMALFADRAAADEITRRGRDVLQQVVDALRERGVALLEADTDGVFFAVPPEWSEVEERALVADVGATLPAGLRLEYEGRYRAMLSHEVKNYALLTYDGQLIVRGVALRSSRAEPYGERFLRAALRAALTGDVARVAEVWTDILTALREGKLTAADVATRARLTKTPAQYECVRSRQREAPYEALLGAGRAEWSRGERVRFYKNAAGEYVWLPDAEETQHRDSAAQALDSRHDYDVEHYVQLLLNSYASRLRKAFTPEDFAQIFRTDGQTGLFDTPLEMIAPIWIRAY